jgi:ATP/maltotriose-dependent transcriptional regulator MalT
VPAAFVRDQQKVAALGITPRELEVLQLIAEGLSNKEIAVRVFVSENTVKTHLVNIAYTSLEPLPVGLLFALVAAGVLRGKRRTAA